MYQDAGVELTAFHVGGDEVPEGIWEGSSICRTFMQENELTNIRDLKDYFWNKYWKCWTNVAYRQSDGKT